jgi:hypothetical protein
MTLIGLALQMPTPCICGAVTAGIEAGRGPHVAGLRCSACGKHRGWMSHEAHRFITAVAQKFGRPAGPIVVRAKNLETASLGADAAPSTSAPETTEQRNE